MHIPDGFLGPQTWLPAAGVAGAGWAWSLRRLRARLRQDTVPTLGVVTACSFGLMLLSLPLPVGGATVHATGLAVLALRFGLPLAFLALSFVLAVQALLLADGGVTSLPVTALALGLVGGGTAIAVYRLLERVHLRAALFLAGWCGTVAAAVVTAIVLGLQPTLAQDAWGEPLFFPFGLRTTLPAVVLPHMAVGILEGALTVGALQALGGVPPREKP